jgi:transcriptional regulator with XRE-family HTH domain
MNISDNIKRIREEKRLSQAEISRRLNLDPSAYFRLEKRGNKLTLDQIEDIAKALEVHPIELLGLMNSSNGEAIDIKKSSELNLEKRIAELEDKVKDKESIISFQTDKLGQYQSLVETIINQYTRSKAREYGLMTYIEIVDEGDKIPLKLKGKSTEVITFFKQKGITHFEGHITDKYDLKDTIELAFENEFYVADSIYKLATMANINLELLKTWEEGLHKYKMRILIPIGIYRKAKVNHELIDVSNTPQKVIK